MTALLNISIAEAKFFQCTFTEPFFNLLISTKNKIVTLDSEESAFTKNIEVKSINNKIDEILINDNIIINVNTAGSNGISEDSYPYSIKYIDEAGGVNYGGCSSEEKYYSTMVSRLPSLDSFGVTMVNYWPGEYGYVSGFKATEDVVIPANEIFSDIEGTDPVNDSKSCKIKAGKMFVPSLGTKGEIFASIFTTKKYVAQRDFNQTIYEDENRSSKVTYKKGTIVYELAYGAEGIYLIEVNGKIKSDISPASWRETPESQPAFLEVDGQGNPIKSPTLINDSTKGFVYTKCDDGHWTWIPTKYMEKSNSFEYARDSERLGE